MHFYVNKYNLKEYTQRSVMCYLTFCSGVFVVWWSDKSLHHGCFWLDGWADRWLVWPGPLSSPARVCSWGHRWAAYSGRPSSEEGSTSSSSWTLISLVDLCVVCVMMNLSLWFHRRHSPVLHYDVIHASIQHVAVSIDGAEPAGQHAFIMFTFCVSLSSPMIWHYLTKPCGSSPRPNTG